MRFGPTAWDEIISERAHKIAQEREANRLARIEAKQKQKEIIDTFEEISRTYDELRIEVSHVLEDDNFVTIRYKYYIRTIENPDEELGIAHFIAIWEIKDGKLYRGHQISQPVMSIDDSNGTYNKVKV